jgi:hypothetical protein
MLSRKLTRFIAAGAVVGVIGGATYGILNTGSGGSGTAGAATTPTTTAAASVIPFDRGNPSPSTVVGQVPQGWSAGSGTIVTGTAANKAKAAAVAAYPGGIINRVVLLSNGDYNVHVIGVNWPHHVFVSKDFKVIGAE